MKKIKRIAIIVLAFMLVCTLFVACNAKNNADVNGGQPTQKVERKPTADPNPLNPSDVPSADDITDWRTTSREFEYTRMYIMFTNSESLNNLFYDYTLEDFDTEKFVSVCEKKPKLLQDIRKLVEEGDLSNRPRQYNRSLWLTLKHPSRENVLQYVDEFRAEKGIYDASPEVVTIAAGWFATTNDERLGNQQSVFEKIELFDAWDTTTGSSNVKVGVVDTNIICAVGTNEADRRRTCLEH